VLPLAAEVDIMEQAHWLSRKRASLLMATNAASASARLIHYELAGRYSVKAAEAGGPHMHLEDAPPIEAYGAGNPRPRSPEQRS
jgi:hypothetical protein